MNKLKSLLVKLKEMNELRLLLEKLDKVGDSVVEDNFTSNKYYNMEVQEYNDTIDSILLLAPHLELNKMVKVSL